MNLGFPLSLLSLTPQEKEICFKIRTGNGGWIARQLNKRISLPISIYLARWGVSPNQITAFNMMLGIVSGILAAFGGYQNLLMAGLLFQLVSIFDGCDGEVAKLNHCSTTFGAWFDTVGDNLSFVVFITGVTFGLYHETHAAWILTTTEISLISFALLLSIMISYLIQQKSDSASLTIYEKEIVSKSVKNPDSWAAKAVYYGKFLVKKDFFAFLFFVLAICNLPDGIIFFAALGSSAVAVILLILTVLRMRARKSSLAERATEVIQ
jgi:phosphatidylglycerophosphate synthase